jgi:hypothetical protein
MEECLGFRLHLGVVERFRSCAPLALSPPPPLTQSLGWTSADSGCIASTAFHASPVRSRAVAASSASGSALPLELRDGFGPKAACRAGSAPRYVRGPFTRCPGTYRVRLKCVARRGCDSARNRLTVASMARKAVRRLDLAATAGGTGRTVDLVVNGVPPPALESGPGHGGEGAVPKQKGATIPLRDACQMLHRLSPGLLQSTAHSSGRTPSPSSSAIPRDIPRKPDSLARNVPSHRPHRPGGPGRKGMPVVGPADPADAVARLWRGCSGQGIPNSRGPAFLQVMGAFPASAKAGSCGDLRLRREWRCQSADPSHATPSGTGTRVVRSPRAEGKSIRRLHGPADAGSQPGSLVAGPWPRRCARLRGSDRRRHTAWRRRGCVRGTAALWVYGPPAAWSGRRWPGADSCR